MSSSVEQDGGSLDQVLKEAKRIPEEILGKVSIAVSLWQRLYYIILAIVLDTSVYIKQYSPGLKSRYILELI